MAELNNNILGDSILRQLYVWGPLWMKRPRISALFAGRGAVAATGPHAGKADGGRAGLHPPDTGACGGGAHI